jgi:hypothetical protein
MKNTILLVGGVAILGGVGYLLYTRNKNQSFLPASSSPGSSVAPTNQSTPSPNAALAPTVKQTMWKDKDGNVFQLTSEKAKWGFVIKVNGAIHGKWNQMETMFLRPDGHVVGVDNNGSVFEWKNNQWNYVIKDNKSEAGAYLMKYGQPNVYQSISGLGCYIMS